jgi:YHS domain-containing protein
MNKLTIVSLTGIVVVLSFLAIACGKSEQRDSAAAAAAEEVKIGHAGMEDQHNIGNHPQEGHPHAADAPIASQKALKNGFDGMPASGTPAHCPVMKNDFKVTADSTFSVYKGKTYVFCCPGCKPQFEADPEKYI